MLIIPNIRKITSIILMIISSLMLSACFYSLKKPKCDRYRKGTFYYQFKIDEKIFHYTVTRNDSMQIEVNSENGNIAKYKLRWTNDCSYELKFIEGTEILPEKLLDLKKTMVVQTTILGGTDDYYLFKSTSNLNDRVLSDTVWLKK